MTVALHALISSSLAALHAQGSVTSYFRHSMSNYGLITQVRLSHRRCHAELLSFACRDRLNYRR